MSNLFQIGCVILSLRGIRREADMYVGRRLCRFALDPSGLKSLRMTPREKRAFAMRTRYTTASQKGRTVLRLLRRPEQNFADERLRFLGDEHGHGVSYVVRLQHLRRVLAFVGAEIGVNRAGANH
jgi:hypothetical protein